MTTRLFLVRHGATALQHRRSFLGAPRAPSFPIRDVRKRSVLANDCDPTAYPLFTAVRIRERWTPRGSSRRDGPQPPVPVDGLREISHGHWEGLRRTGSRRAICRRVRDVGTGSIYLRAKRRRIRTGRARPRAAGASAIIADHQGSKILVVSHKATIRLLLSSLLGIDARGYRDRLDQAPACLNVLDFSDLVRARLMLFNDTSHYTAMPSHA